VSAGDADIDETAGCCGIVIPARIEQAAEVADTLARIPPGLAARLGSITVLWEGVDAEGGAQPEPALPSLPQLASLSSLRAASTPRRYGYGGRRKLALEHALEQGWSYVVVMEADGRFAPEELERLLEPVRDGSPDLVIASRAATARGRLRRRLRLRSLVHRLLTGMRVGDVASGFRLYGARLLQRVPFRLNFDDRRFDAQILLQARALGAVIAEAPVSSEAISAPPQEDELSPWRHATVSLSYRCHQLHLSRAGEFLVDHGVHYTLKHSPTSSHMQLLSAIRPGSRVLDLGCSQGLLASLLARSGTRVTGVDVMPPDAVSDGLEAYCQHDLESPLQLPEGWTFDYVLLADVLEHLHHRTQLLRGVRRHLRPGGRLLVSAPNIAIWFYRLSLLVGRFEYGPRGILDETHVHLFTRATLRRQIEQAGFRICSERVTSLPYEVVFESTGRSRLLAFVDRCYHLLARLWPEMFAYQIIVEAEVAGMIEG
jgi:2-polyprenyl-3-methyl-5-hydroxy-6-metoxy-1,4-benzoquinol methylase